jgi:hypothetical protein
MGYGVQRHFQQYFSYIVAFQLLIFIVIVLKSLYISGETYFLSKRFLELLFYFYKWKLATQTSLC